MRFNDGGGDLTGQTATEALAIAKTYLKRTIPDIKEYYIRYEMGKGGSHSMYSTDGTHVAASVEIIPEKD